MENNEYEIIIYYLYARSEKDFIDIKLFATSEAEAFEKAKELKRWTYDMEIVSINGETLKEKIQWKQWKLKQHIPEKTIL